MLGYLKKIARIDTTNKTQNLPVINPQQQQQLSKQKSHRVDQSSTVPRITFMEASSKHNDTDSASSNMATVSAYNTWERSYHYGQDDNRPTTSTGNICPPNMMITSMPCEEEDDELHDIEEEELELGPVTTERTKRRRARHLLPSPFRNLLPPVSPGRTRTNSCSSRSSSSGFKSTVSGDEGGHLGAGTSVTSHSASSASSRERHSATSGKMSRKTKSNLRSPTMLCGDKENTRPPRTATDPSPTTLCPTIASALWKPLWPPGEPSPCTLSLSLAHPSPHIAHVFAYVRVISFRSYIRDSLSL